MATSEKIMVRGKLYTRLCSSDTIRAPHTDKAIMLRGVWFPYSVLSNHYEGCNSSAWYVADWFLAEKAPELDKVARLRALNRSLADIASFRRDLDTATGADEFSSRTGARYIREAIEELKAEYALYFDMRDGGAF